MNILFMGTTNFCLPILNILLVENYNIIAVVTKPDNIFGKNKYTAVKKFAIEKNILILQPNNLDNFFLETIDKLNIDIIIVAAYGKILPEKILKKYKCINIHGSLLPKYRGPSPIQYAILNGDKFTGITIIEMNNNIDAGKILLQKKISILPIDNTKILMEKLSIVGAKLLIYYLKNIKNIIPIKQINKHISYTKLLNKKDSYINWNFNFDEILNFINAMYLWPTARTIIDKYIVKIYEAKLYHYENNNYSIKNGVIIHKNYNDGLCIKCNNGIIEIIKLQFPNLKVMSAKEYILGHNIKDEYIYE